MVIHFTGSQPTKSTARIQQHAAHSAQHCQTWFNIVFCCLLSVWRHLHFSPLFPPSLSSPPSPSLFLSLPLLFSFPSFLLLCHKHIGVAYTSACTPGLVFSKFRVPMYLRTFYILLKCKHDRVCVEVRATVAFSQNKVYALLRRKKPTAKKRFFHNEAFLENLISCYPSMNIRKPSCPVVDNCLNYLGRVCTAWQGHYT